MPDDPLIPPDLPPAEPEPEASTASEPARIGSGKPGPGRRRVYDRKRLSELWADPDKFASRASMARSLNMPESALRKILNETGGDHQRALEAARRAETAAEAEKVLNGLISTRSESLGGKRFDEHDAWKNRLLLIRLRDDTVVAKDIRAKLAMWLAERYDRLLPQDIHESDERVCTKQEVAELYKVTGDILGLDAERDRLTAILAAIPDSVESHGGHSDQVRQPEGFSQDTTPAAS